MQEQQQSVVRIDDLSTHHLMQFIYTGNPSVSTWEEAVALLQAADKYALPALKEWCSSRLHALVSVDTIRRTLTLIDRYGLPETLLARCRDIILSNPDKLMNNMARDFSTFEGAGAAISASSSSSSSSPSFISSSSRKRKRSEDHDDVEEAEEESSMVELKESAGGVGSSESSVPH